MSVSLLSDPMVSGADGFADQSEGEAAACLAHGLVIVVTEGGDAKVA